MVTEETPCKPTEFMGSALDNLREFPEEVRFVMGHAIYLAQIGDKHPDAKPLRGDPDFRGAGVLEVVDHYDGDTYRAVYTVKLAGVVYVLHAFQKKSKSGIATPQKEIDLIKVRLKVARNHYQENYQGKREVS